MTVEKEKLSDLKEKYEKAERLVEEESKNDPPTEPYKSHYEAKDILIEIQNNIKNTLSNLEANGQAAAAEIYTFILGHIIVDLGKICIHVDELSSGEKYLEQGIELLSKYQNHPSAVCPYLQGQNQLGILWSNRGDVKKAKECLVQAENVYNAFKASGKAPLTIYDIFGTADEIEVGKGDGQLEKINTLTLFYLAQIFGNDGELHKSAVYCHTTLKKQLEMKEYDSIDWALNAATLSQYFCTNNRYKEARHHLAAATHILEEYEKDYIKPEMSEEEKSDATEVYRHRSADVWRCWAKYGLNLLSDSRERLLMDDAEIQKIDALRLSEELTFTSLSGIAHENIVTDRYLLDMDDARPVFIASQKWIDAAKDYYTAESEASEYAKIVQDHALLYKNLTFFESDTGNQAKMHKRRADLLEGLLQLLNPTFYLAICREVYYELGLTYSNMLDIKLDALDASTKTAPPNPHALKKVNDLSKKSIAKFQTYIDSYCEKNSDKLKGDLTHEDIVPIAYAHFQIGRLWYKLITPDKHMQIVNLGESLKNYQKFVNICEEHAKVGDEMKGETGVSKEMISLLPIKINKLQCDLAIAVAGPQ